MQVRQIRLADIRIKNRARDDKGDIEGLAAAIKEHGLLRSLSMSR